jgi:beta-lactamase regulating signal transducer with metallopeptidase domain
MTRFARPTRTVSPHAGSSGRTGAARRTFRRLRGHLAVLALGMSALIALPGTALASTDNGQRQSTGATVSAGSTVSGGAAHATHGSPTNWLPTTLAVVVVLLAVLAVAVLLQRAARGRRAVRPTAFGV